MRGGREGEGSCGGRGRERMVSQRAGVGGVIITLYLCVYFVGGGFNCVGGFKRLYTGFSPPPQERGEMPKEWRKTPLGNINGGGEEVIPRGCGHEGDLADSPPHTA